MPTNKVSRLNIMSAMKMKPERAIEYLRSLGLQIDDLFAEQALIRARGRAFTVASIQNARVVDQIYQEILAAIEAGQTPDYFLKRIKPELAKKGYYSTDVPAYRLKQMMRGNMQTAFNAGRFEAQKANIDNQPWWIRIEVIDERTRPSHEAVHKIAARADDPYWNNNYPPFLDGKFEYGCRGRVRAESDKRFQAMLKSDPTIRVIESNDSHSESVMDDLDTMKQDGIKQISSQIIQDQLRDKLYG